MIRAVKAHPAVEWLMSEGDPEVSFQWNDAHWNVPCKCRFDWLRPDGIAMDLKTTVDASPEEFPRAVASFKYHLQNRWYDIGHEHLRDESLRGFAFVAVENVAPYGVAVYTIEPNALAFANGRIEEALMRYKNARDRGSGKATREDQPAHAAALGDDRHTHLLTTEGSAMSAVIEHTQTTVPQAQSRGSILAKFASKYEGAAGAHADHAQGDGVPSGRDAPEVSDEQMIALLIVADQYGLNPFTKEIYAFPDKHKGIVPVVGVDGWSRIMK